MRLLRISIGRLMVVIVFIAIASVAILRPSRLAASLAFAATFGVLTVSTVAVIVDRPRFRGFAEGFAIGGWLFFAAHFCNVFSIASPANFNSQYNPPLLPTTMLLDLVFPRIVEGSYQPTLIIPGPSKIAPVPLPPMPTGGAIPPIPPPPGSGSGGSPVPVITVSGPSPVFIPPPSVATSRDFWTEIDRGTAPIVPARSASFMTIGFCISTLIHAVLCGGMASWLRTRRGSERASSTS